ncbi:DUF3667 domain-containing protein [Lacinutrix sp.]|uniref:DUF3667 domain-containing protein n=1 Tax=Lacinutrix sp. TaxID=1937692 RepID=UPI0035C7FC3A
MKSKEELTLSVLFYNTLNNYLLYDSKFFKSFFPLIARPGFLPNTFIDGKRLSFFTQHKCTCSLLLSSFSYSPLSQIKA